VVVGGEGGGREEVVVGGEGEGREEVVLAVKVKVERRWLVNYGW
jgi:hypothetical protein